MTTSKKITLGLISLLLVEVYTAQFSDREQLRGFTLANVGETVKLTCFYQDNYVTYIVWYKQTSGDIPQLVSSHMKSDENGQFYHQFKSNPRFSVQHGKGINHLKISALRLSDSGTYYCGTLVMYLVEFTTRVILHVNGSGSDMEIIAQQPVFESVKPGVSVTLNCEVHTEICDGEHSVYRFRRSGESQVQIFYTHDGQCKESHGYKSDNCERIFKAGSSTQSCTYSLPMKNLTFSDAGTYYCAATSCGEILFGNRTKLEIEDPMILLLVYCLGAALAVSFILIIVLAYMVYKLNEKTCLQCRGQLRGSPLSQDALGHDADNLHYAALSLNNKKNRPRSQRDNMERDTVYSGVRE